MNNAIILSIKPKYADKIFSGQKTVELRRIKPKFIKEGSVAIIYISSPRKELHGVIKISRIVEEPLNDLWSKVEGKAQVSKIEFDKYYENASNGVAFYISKVWSLNKPLKLHEIVLSNSIFQPPQSFQYINIDDIQIPSLKKMLNSI